MARKTKQLAVRDQFLILTNGKRSEKQYFEALRAKFHSIFKITVKFLNNDPEALVRHAIAEKTDANRVWCVFDQDEFPKESIYRAIQNAKQNKIGVAFSNIAFEVWILDHFQRCDVEKSVNELIAEINAQFTTIGYRHEYAKADESAVKEVFLPRLETALHNAAVAYQKRILEYRKGHQDTTYPVCAWASYTDVHKLVEALQLKSKE